MSWFMGGGESLRSSPSFILSSRADCEFGLFSLCLSIQQSGCGLRAVVFLLAVEAAVPSCLDVVPVFSVLWHFALYVFPF